MTCPYQKKNNWLKSYLFFPFLVFLFTSVTTKAQVANDSCFQAVEVFCGDSLMVVVNENDQVNSYDFENCGSFYFGWNRWYKFIGTGEMMYISLNTERYYPKLDILDNGCDSLSCVESYSYLDKLDNKYKIQKVFKSEAGKS